jgi:NAD(P)-dependent dehydrogenase (short-subunit alcohol dehydrogenase family)
MSVIEATAMDTVRSIFDANTFGTIAVTQAFLPQLRQQRRGAIVNVSSSTTLAALPMLAVYTASKAAVNAFTESLALELEAFDVRVGLVIPGRSPETPFAQSARARAQAHGVAVPDAYAEFCRAVAERHAAQQSSPTTRATDVAEAIWRFATDPSCPSRLPAGADAVELAASH